MKKNKIYRSNKYPFVLVIVIFIVVFGLLNLTSPATNSEYVKSYNLIVANYQKNNVFDEIELNEFHETLIIDKNNLQNHKPKTSFESYHFELIRLYEDLIEISKLMISNAFISKEIAELADSFSSRTILSFQLLKDSLDHAGLKYTETTEGITVIFKTEDDMKLLH